MLGALLSVRASALCCGCLPRGFRGCVAVFRAVAFAEKNGYKNKKTVADIGFKNKSYNFVLHILQNQALPRTALVLLITQK